MIGKIYKAEEDAFKMLLQLDTVRGPHSTGVLSVSDKYGDFLTHKKAGTPWDLFASAKWGEVFTKRNHKVLLGHNRWATVGVINDENAHPFQHGGIIGVHNGTIRNKTELLDHKDHEVDSSNVFYEIGKTSPEDVLKKVRGAFVFVWYDQETHQLHMVRNSERPLFTCWSKDKKTMFWASEAWMLMVALNKANIEHTQPEMLPTGKLFTFNPPLLGDWKYEDMEAAVEDVEFAKPHIVYNHNGYDRYNQGNYNRYANSGGSTALVPLRKRSDESGKQLSDYVGKKTKFEVVGHREIQKQVFVLCQTDDDAMFDIRVYVDTRHKLYKRLINGTAYFTATIKDFVDSVQHGRYLKVDNRTIKEVTYVGDEEDDMVRGKDGKPMTLQEFYDATSCGCNWCSSHPNPSEADDIEWLSMGYFLCGTCAKDPDVTQWLPHLNPAALN